MVKKMNLYDLIRKALDQHSMDGLFNSEIGCGCCCDDLMPCCNPDPDCIGGWKWTVAEAKAAGISFESEFAADDDWVICGIRKPDANSSRE